MPDFRYEGPPALIVALQREVVSGDVVKNGPDALRFAAGFHEIEKPGKAAKPADETPKDEA